MIDLTRKLSKEANRVAQLPLCDTNNVSVWIGLLAIMQRSYNLHRLHVRQSICLFTV